MRFIRRHGAKQTASTEQTAERKAPIAGLNPNCCDFKLQNMSGNGDNVKEENPGVLNISIKAQDGTTVQFKIKKTTKLQKVFATYAQKRSVDPSQFRFLFDGTRLKDSLTAEEAELEDGDVIDALVEQIGG